MGNIAHLQSIAAIRSLIESSVFIIETPNEKENGKYDSYRYYVCGLRIGGVAYTARSSIAVDSQGNRYYDHKLTKIEKGTLLSAMVGITNPVSQQNSSLSEYKDKVLLSILQTNSSKVVDPMATTISTIYTTTASVSKYGDK